MMGTNPGKAERHETGSLYVKCIVCVAVMIGLLHASPPPAARGDIYWFKDEHGVVHMSNVPVDGRFRFKEREKGQEVSKTLYEKGRRGYDDLIVQVARAEGLDVDLLRAVVEAESNYDANAISKKGAIGLMQLMPETARGMGVADPFHPAENLAAGARYLRGLLDKYRGRLPLALAAYNAGEKAVDRYKGVPPYPETQGYVKKVLKAYGRGKKAQRAVGGQGKRDGS
jgi:soluble lytic murein transglycosylase